MGLRSLAMKRFCCNYSLKTGGYVVGIVYTAIMVVILIPTLMQVFLMKIKDDQHMIYKYPWRNAYGYSITAVLYSLIMLIVNLWFLWGVHTDRPSVIISWVVVTGTWLLLCLCLLIAMVVILSTEKIEIYWGLSLFFGLLALCILLYGVMVGLSIWVDLKKRGTRSLSDDSF